MNLDKTPKNLNEEFSRMRSLIGNVIPEQEAETQVTTTAAKVFPASICAFVPILATGSGAPANQTELTGTIVSAAEFASYATKIPQNKAMGLIRVDVAPFFLDKISAVDVPTSGQIKVRIANAENGVGNVIAAVVTGLGQLVANKAENGKPILVSGYFINLERLLKSPFDESGFLKLNFNTDAKVREMIDPAVYDTSAGLFKTFV